MQQEQASRGDEADEDLALAAGAHATEAAPGRVAEEQEHQRGDLAGAGRAQPPAQRQEQQRRHDRDGEIGGRHDALVGPDRPQHGVGRVDPRRLLIPGVAVRQLAMQDALPDVAVERLVGAGRLLQRGDAQRDAHREQRPEDPARQSPGSARTHTIPGRGIPAGCVAHRSLMSNKLALRALPSGRRAPGLVQALALPGDAGCAPKWKC